MRTLLPVGVEKRPRRRSTSSDSGSRVAGSMRRRRLRSWRLSLNTLLWRRPQKSPNSPIPPPLRGRRSKTFLPSKSSNLLSLGFQKFLRQKIWKIWPLMNRHSRWSCCSRSASRHSNSNKSSSSSSLSHSHSSHSCRHLNKLYNLTNTNSKHNHSHSHSRKRSPNHNKHNRSHKHSNCNTININISTSSIFLSKFGRCNKPQPRLHKSNSHHTLPLPGNTNNR
mmetsp:Transcript_34970/g.74364  ORF Transcript_34970/g.74364 Transcript_34970/m.74364 type:complete len:223 (+) Transcript_34970:795-1463(+)